MDKKRIFCYGKLRPSFVRKMAFFYRNYPVRLFLIVIPRCEIWAKPGSHYGGQLWKDKCVWETIFKKSLILLWKSHTKNDVAEKGYSRDN